MKGRNILLGIVLLTSILFTTIVYAAFNTQLNIEGEAIVRSDQDIRITNISISNAANGAYETYNNKYNKDTTFMYVTLPANSSITYEVEITNKNNSDYYIEDLIKEIDSNQNINNDISFSLNETINANSTKTFIITLTNNTSTEQQETLIYKYTFKDKIYITKYIQNLYDMGTIGLVDDNTSDNNLRFTGSNPDNYVYFNDELWRIIGLFNNVEDNYGNSSSLIKIVRAESIGNYSFDTSDTSINNGNGINQWGESIYYDNTAYEGSDLMRELNNDYLGNIMVGTDGKWYNQANNEKQQLMPSQILNSSSIDMIEDVKWYTGSANDNILDSSSITAYTAYENEKKSNPNATNNGKYCSLSVTSGGIYYCNDNIVRTTYWIGKVGLISLSDYGFASNCFEDSIYLRNYNVSTCSSNNWLINRSVAMHTITPIARQEIAISVFRINTDGSVYEYNNSSNGNSIFPTLFLKNDVYIYDGNGTYNNPYKIKK